MWLTRFQPTVAASGEREGQRGVAHQVSIHSRHVRRLTSQECIRSVLSNLLKSNQNQLIRFNVDFLLHRECPEEKAWFSPKIPMWGILRVRTNCLFPQVSQLSTG